MRKDYLEAHPEILPSIAVNSPLLLHCSEPEDITDAVLFFAGNSARMITDANLMVNCGKMCT